MTPPRPPLLPGERVLWEGAPPRGLRLDAEVASEMSFLLVWTGMAVFFSVLAWTGHGNWMSRLMSVLLVASGLYGLIGAPLYEAWVRGGQRYVVTTRRVMVRDRRRGDRLRSLDIGRLPVVVMDQRADGSGDLQFEPKEYRRGKGGRPIERHRLTPG